MSRQTALKSSRLIAACALLYAGCNHLERFDTSGADALDVDASGAEAPDVGAPDLGAADARASCLFRGLDEGVCAGATPDQSDSFRCSAPLDFLDEELGACDGLDNDCDGVVDEGCSCAYGASAQGVCGAGRIGVEGGACEPPMMYEANESACDGYDNDCDGVTDEGCARCAFEEPRADQIAPPSAQGACAFGRPGAEGSCERPAAYMNTEDECRQDPSAGDLIDNDCDGIVDEGCACPFEGNSRGVCSAGRRGRGDSCAEPRLYEPDESLCDGYDNDCDGEVDEGCARRALPPSFDPPSRVIALSAGMGHACALLQDGRVACWGSGRYGKLGSGTEDNAPRPQFVSGLGAASAIGASWHASCARTTMNGFVECWGAMHADNELLDEADRAELTWFTPRRLMGEWGGRVAAIEGGFYHMCSLSAQGSVACWGRNYGAQLGRDPKKGDSLDFGVRVDGLGGEASAIATGHDTSCAIVAGKVWCWGRDTKGQLGDGDGVAPQNSSAVPVRVVGIEGASAIAIGNRFACALIAQGRVACWGENELGAIGDETAGGVVYAPSEPVALSEPATAISARDKAACALLASGAIECWGYNDTGVLGDNSALNMIASRPVAVRGIGDATRIAVGGSFACALRASGRVSCWGSHHTGQLGDGLEPKRGSRAASPVFVVWPRGAE